MSAPTLTREKGSLGVGCCLFPEDDVVKCTLDAHGVIEQQPQGSVALNTQKSSDNVGFVAMVDMEKLALGRCFQADGTYAILLSELGFKIFLSDSIESLNGKVPTIFLLPLFHGGGSLFFVKSAIFLIGQLLYVLAFPAARFDTPTDDINFTETPSTPTPAGFSVDLSESMLKIENASTFPCAGVSTVPFDRNKTTAVADGAAITDVNLGQLMAISSAVAGVSTDVNNGLPFYPSSSVLVSGSDDGLLSTSTVTETIGDFTVRITAQAIFVHR